MSTLKDWTRVADVEALKAKGQLMVRIEGKQILLNDTADGILACNNRCPHEGFPLSEGSLDTNCLLTCNWHNWKFDLRTGESVYGGDRLRTYPVAVRDDGICLDLSEPPAAVQQQAILKNLHHAFDDNAYARLGRELARWQASGRPLPEAVASAIIWSHDRFEWGMTHAYAGAADWLALQDEYNGNGVAQLACAMEAIGHMADDTLRRPQFPYEAGQLDYDEDGFVEALEQEDQSTAIKMIRGGLAAGLGFDGMAGGLSRGALAHYQDFGHALIYVTKAGALITRLGEAVAEPVLLTLVRGLIYARREDLIPEFRGYGPALAAWGDGDEAAPAADLYTGLNIARALALTVAHSGAKPTALYQALLGANAANLLTFDTDVQDRLDGKIGDNAGWLDLSHGLTFANAVRQTCNKYPKLWPAGLLQMACFAGRNAPYTDANQDTEMWRVTDPEAFLTDAIDGLFDHGRGEYIESVHRIKTTLAARAERDGAAGATVLAAANRLLNARLKRKHVWRTAQQSLNFVATAG